MSQNHIEGSGPGTLRLLDHAMEDYGSDAEGLSLQPLGADYDARHSTRDTRHATHDIRL